jgi:tetratricopeptide (TPR) repeat protein
MQETSVEDGETDVKVTLVAEPRGTGKQSAVVAAMPTKALKEMEKALQTLRDDKLDAAADHLRRTLEISSNSADANYLMGVLWLKRQDAKQATVYLDKAVKLSATHDGAWLALGHAELLQADYPRAAAALEESVTLNPSSWQAQWLAGEAAFRLKEFARAAERTEAALRAGPEEARPAKLLLGRAQAALGQREAALVTIEQYLQELPAANAAERSEATKLVIQLRSTQQMETDAALNSPAEGAGSVAVPSIAPVTQIQWAPRDVDEERPAVEAGTSCAVKVVTEAAGARVEDLVNNVNRYSATEKMVHESLSPLGVRLSKDERTFNYLASILPTGPRTLDVQEYRDGSVSAENFPANLATMGLPMLALAFHSYCRQKFDFTCEGRGEWRGRPAWVVYYRQRDVPMNEMRAYRMNGKEFPVRLKGWAWIDVGSSQILAMEADLLKTVPEIQLVRDRQTIEYGPAEFRKSTMSLWLPKSADWYCDFKAQRYHRRHTFSNFVLFTVDVSQKIGKPPNPEKH